MKEAGIIFIFTLMFYIQNTSTLKISLKPPEDKLTDIPARSEDNRMLNSKNAGDSNEYANIAQIYYPYYPNPDDPTFKELWCRGVMIHPIYVVTVAHCFDEVILSKTERRRFSNFAVFFKQINSSLFTGRLAWVGIGRNGSLGHGTYVQLDKLFIHDQYDTRFDQNNEVDIAMIKLREAVPKNIAAPPYGIGNALGPGSDRMYPPVQDCWTASAGYTSPDEVTCWDVKPLEKMKVFVGNYKYCSVLEEKLYQGKKLLKYNEEYLCATTNESVDPGARLCTGDDGAAIVCGNRKLFGLLSRRHESGKCQGENAYGKYIYLGNRNVYRWIGEIMSGKIKPDDIYRGDESASGLVEASKAVTWVLTLISLAVTLNTCYWNVWHPMTWKITK